MGAYMGPERRPDTIFVAIGNYAGDNSRIKDMAKSLPMKIYTEHSITEKVEKRGIFQHVYVLLPLPCVRHYFVP